MLSFYIAKDNLICFFTRKLKEANTSYKEYSCIADVDDMKEIFKTIRLYHIPGCFRATAIGQSNRPSPLPYMHFSIRQVIIYFTYSFQIRLKSLYIKCWQSLSRRWTLKEVSILNTNLCQTLNIQTYCTLIFRFMY